MPLWPLRGARPHAARRQASCSAAAADARRRQMVASLRLKRRPRMGGVRQAIVGEADVLARLHAAGRAAG
eukprot:1363675-Prymnesium_polylepis.1